ncbi:MaoC/PaaZ C-terminal domain-containing protein [Nonomuraea jiangxiensis]|uniref:Acyl dehydratase n=1 Tax=Nonomuraea jiangxiensis TaxID=633440 RepID=A0A1G9KHE8_9ACTN|nr:MaoC/PaaZ C-terminal domain-containing protein [Nonomuraea jiangxiensis]SDL49059.1 Acyl dehydratase [Nonomuraea jiangxiensis]
MRTLTAHEVTTGTALPPSSVELTPTMVISTALATMDFTPVHHDTALARAQGSKDIFLNILTTMGLVERYVTDWAGPAAVIGGINVRLGVPAYAGDRLSFEGTVVSDADGRFTVEVRGRVSLGDHATGTVTLTLPAGRAG